MDIDAIVKKAVENHDGGEMNCAQSVLCALGEYTGLDDASARCIASGFGGGVRSGEICGAIAGAVMATGLVNGKDDRLCGKAGSLSAYAAKDIVAKFREEYGCTGCTELIKNAGGHRCCGEFIAFCARAAAENMKNVE